MEAQWGFQEGQWGRQVAAGEPPDKRGPGAFDAWDKGFGAHLFLAAWFPNCEPQRAAREMRFKSVCGAVLGFAVLAPKPRR